MTILFVVCGRAGSKGFKNKNLKEMNGVALVYYTLAAIYLFKKKHKNYGIDIALNTDSQELIQLAKEQKKLRDIRIIERKSELAGDRTPKVDVIKDTYIQCKQYDNYNLVVDLDITSPLRRVVDIENVINQFNLKRCYDLAFSVVPARRSPYFNMVEKQGDYYKKVCASDFTARQQAPRIYELNASIYAYDPLFLESEINKTILDYRCGISEMIDYLVLDIDSEKDFFMMSHLMNYFELEDAELAEVIQTARSFND